MINNKKILAVIPARGGSKRISKKNIADVGGKPLVAYTIETARGVSEIDKTVVSSEDDEILSIASACGAEALRRPPELALDHVKDEPVLIQALSALEERGEFFDYLVMLQPTSPFRKAETVRKVIAAAVNNNFDVMGTVIEDRSYFWKCEGGVWSPLYPNAPRRSQDRVPLYKEAGVCYIMKSASLKETGKIFTGKIGFIIVNETEGVDINAPLDLELARFIKSKETL